MANSHVFIWGNYILKRGDFLKLFLTHSRANPGMPAMGYQSGKPPVTSSFPGSLWASSPHLTTPWHGLLLPHLYRPDIRTGFVIIQLEVTNQEHLWSLSALGT